MTSIRSIPRARPLALALATLLFVCASGFSAGALAQPVGSLGALAAAQQAVGQYSLPTPPLPSANGPSTTPAFEAASGALVVNGNQTVQEVDIQTHSLIPLTLVRTVNQAGAGALFGTGWATNLDRRLDLSRLASEIVADRPDGSQIVYVWNAADAKYENASPDAKDWIVKNGNGTYSLIAKSGAVENYDSAGYVSTTADPTGLGLIFI